MISIIVPVYNSEKYLIKCVKSICNQTYKDLQIILIDDGSTDNSPELCDKLAQEDTRIVVIHKENGGSTSARNAGLKISKGQYIGFVDSDDWIEPNMYKVLLENCISNNAQLVVCARYINNGKSEYKEDLCISEGLYRKSDFEKTIINNMFYTKDYKKNGITTSLWDKLFSRELIFKHQFKVDERTKYAEDDICVYSCLLDAERVSFVDKAFYHYRMHEESITHIVDDTYFEKISIFYQQMKDVLINHPDSIILMQKLKKYMLSNILRGVNSLFGFTNHSIIPYYIPPYRLLKEKKVSSLVLYGAGKVGQDYYQSFKRMQYVKVIGWVDKQYEKYKNQEFSVMPVEEIINMKYDCILIAVENEELAKSIIKNLVSMGVMADCILWEVPENIISNLGEML